VNLRSLTASTKSGKCGTKMKNPLGVDSLLWKWLCQPVRSSEGWNVRGRMKGADDGGCAIVSSPGLAAVLGDSGGVTAVCRK